MSKFDKFIFRVALNCTGGFIGNFLISRDWKEAILMGVVVGLIVTSVFVVVFDD